MATNVRVTLAFEARFYSWSEGYWTGRTYATLAGASDVATKLANTRSQLLGANALITEVRLSWGANTDGNNPQLAKVSELLPDGAWVQAGPYTGGGDTYADFPDVCVLVRVQDAKDKRKLIFLSGQPDVLITTRGGNIPEFLPGALPQWQKDFAAFAAELIADFGMRTVQGPLDGAPLTPAVGLVNDAAPPNLIGVQVTNFPVALPAIGTVVQVTRFPHIYGAAQQINGKWVVDHTTTGTRPAPDIIWLRNSQLIDAAAYNKLGYIRTPTLAITAIQSVQAEGAARRKRGVRSFRPLGRRRIAR